MEFDVENYIYSGILEAFVAGTLDPAGMMAVQQMAGEHPLVKDAIDDIELSIEDYFLSQPLIKPAATVKPFVMAIIDYTERLQNGEQPTEPPIITEQSTALDYKEWINRLDMVLPGNFEHIHAKILGYTPTATTAIVWIKEMAPGEVHGDEHEKFLILEGTCDFTIGDETRHLVPGSVLFIPLHVEHHFKVTSLLPCKVILQRIAA